MKISPFYKGIFYTFLATIFWGIPQPLFFNKIKFVPAVEIAFHRGFWSFIFLLIIITSIGKIKDFIFIFKSYKKIIILSFSSILITINWTGFILAVSINKVQDASMGYYMTPMISIILGYIFLKENISRLKLISVLMMFVAIIYLFISLNTFPLLALLIGFTWGVYGLLRKQVEVSSEIGLLYESGFICLFAAPYLIYLWLTGSGYFFNDTPIISVFLLLTGAVTVFPLFFFNVGLKFIPLGFAGVIFFLAPSLHFFTSSVILNEIIETPKIIAFIIIWLAVCIFIFDILKSIEKTNENNTQLLN